MWGILPLQVKKYPGFNLISLIFGPGGDNQKRLEKVRSLFHQLYNNVLRIGQFLSINFVVLCSHLLHALQETGAKIRVYGIKAETGEKVILWLKEKKSDVQI